MCKHSRWLLLYSPPIYPTRGGGGERRLQRARLTPGNALNYVLGLVIWKDRHTLLSPTYKTSCIKTDTRIVPTSQQRLTLITHTHTHAAFSAAATARESDGSNKRLTFLQTSNNFPLATCCSCRQNHCDTEEGNQPITITAFFQFAGSHLF